jgi:tyrosine decarboxylase
MWSLDTKPTGLHSQDGAIDDADNDNVFRPLDPDDVRSYLHKAVDFVADYLQSVESFPVLPNVKPGYLRRRLNPTPPASSAPFDVAVKELRATVVPGTTHWASPNFFAFFPATNSAAAIAGELVASALNTVGFTWQAAPAATELESLALDWLAQLLLLPPAFMTPHGRGGTGGGVILGTTSEAMLVTLVAARDAALHRTGRGGVSDLPRLTAYATDQTHSTFFKVCRLAGFDPANVRTIPTRAETEYALDAAELRRRMQADVDAGLVPTYVCATLGTTSTNAVDPIGATADVARDFGAWVHVDAAYAGSACICPEFRHHLAGVERVDSISLSPHKWLLTCLDCTCLWVRDTRRLTDSLETNPEYLRNDASDSGVVTDVKDMQVGIGHRFRGLKLWMVMRTYGTAKLQQHIRSDVAMAKMFENRVTADDRFEVVVPRNFALVCFRIRARGAMTEDDADEASRELMARLNRTGKAFLAHTVVGGRFVLRFAVGSTLQEEKHMRGAWELIKETASEILHGRAQLLATTRVKI